MKPTQPTPTPYTPPVAPAPMMSPPVTSGIGASKILAGLAVLLIVAAGAYYMGGNREEEARISPSPTPSTVSLPIASPMPSSSSEPTMCTADAKRCPDGSYVSRIAPTCEFAPCPEPTSSVPAGWKTYTNAQYGYQLRYPADWTATTENSIVGFRAPGTKSQPGDFVADVYASFKSNNVQSIIDGIGSQFSDRKVMREDVVINNISAVKVTVTTASHPAWISRSLLFSTAMGVLDINDGAQNTQEFWSIASTFRFTK